MSKASKILEMLKAWDQMNERFRLNIAELPLEDARDFAEEQMNQVGMNLDEQIPNFDENYRTASEKTQDAPDIPRHKMPVIEPEDIEQFQRDLDKGRVDVAQPFALDEPVFPDEFPAKGVTADEWIELGVKDGEPEDDTIDAKLTRVASGDLKPIQGQIWLEKIVGGYTESGVPDSQSPILDKTIIISSDDFILDGHHRWAQAQIADPSLQMSVLAVPFDIDRLLKIARSYSKAIGKVFKQ